MMSASDTEIENMRKNRNVMSIFFKNFASMGAGGMGGVSHVQNLRKLILRKNHIFKKF
jgi:hypothetical protein